MVKSKNNPFVTVVIPMYNEQTYITPCLASLVEQDYPLDYFEVLVVDGGSEDGSREQAQTFARQYRFIRCLDNPRRITAAAMNIGIQQAKGEVIIILGAHSFVAPDFISQNVACLSTTQAACVGGSIRSIAISPLGQTICLAMSSPFGVGNALFRYAQKAQYVDTVAFGAYRREVFDNIGLFDEAMLYNEDDEFNYRLRKNGGTIFLCPSIQAFYYTRTSLLKLVKQYFRYGLGKIRVIQKHPTTASLRHFVPFAFVSTLLVEALVGMIYPLFFGFLLAVMASYLLASLFFSVRIAATHKWRHLPLLPVTFACLHFSYGIGSLIGLLLLLRAWFRGLSVRLAFNPFPTKR